MIKSWITESEKLSVIYGFFYLVLSLVFIHKYSSERGLFVKKWHQKIRRGLIKYMELPSDVILELPRITMIGQLHVYIENHEGLVSYSDSELKLKAHKGYIQVLGSSFVLKKMYPSEILLEGVITDIRFIS